MQHTSSNLRWFFILYYTVFLMGVDTHLIYVANDSALWLLNKFLLFVSVGRFKAGNSKDEPEACKTGG